MEQAVRVPAADRWTPRLGPAEIPCWSVRSGLLGDPVLVNWGSASPLTPLRCPP